jgi:hypothetical protein
MHATANWRAIAEEIWPFLQAPPSTPMGHAEAAWRARHPLPTTSLAASQPGAQHTTSFVRPNRSIVPGKANETGGKLT